MGGRLYNRVARVYAPRRKYAFFLNACGVSSLIYLQAANPATFRRVQRGGIRKTRNSSCIRKEKDGRKQKTEGCSIFRNLHTRDAAASEGRGMFRRGTQENT